MGNEFEFITLLRDAIASRRALGPRLLLAGLVDGPGPNAFGVYDAPPNALAVPPSTFRATLVFYPSATPLRALVRPVIVPDGELSTAAPGMSIAEALAAHAGRLAANPFVGRWPVALAGVTPVVRAGRLFVRDDSGSCLALEPGTVAARIITVSAGGG